MLFRYFTYTLICINYNLRAVIKKGIKFGKDTKILIYGISYLMFEKHSPVLIKYIPF